MRYSSGLLRIGLAGVIWGSIPLFIRMVDVSPLVIVFWRVVFGAAAALVYLLVTRKLVALRRLDRRAVLALVAVGVLLAANWILSCPNRSAGPRRSVERRLWRRAYSWPAWLRGPLRAPAWKRRQPPKCSWSPRPVARATG